MGSNPSSRKIGQFLAKIQATIDDWFEFGFRKLKEVGKSHSKPPEAAPIKDKAVHAAQKSAEFLGDVGETYYKTYKKIKAKKEREEER